MEHIHFIGIGGSGLSAIATVLLERGYTVSGSDRQTSPILLRLQGAGARIVVGHHPENIQEANVVIRSSAVPESNVEVQAALALGLPVLRRVDFLGQLMADQQGIAIAGTHGKTTTTAMIAWMLMDLGLDPSFVIGSITINLGCNAHAGHGRFFVIEADEYDRMFLGINPWLAVVTNVEHDHPDCYPTWQDFYQAFREFTARLKPDGTLVACRDDLGAAQLASEAISEGRRVLTYGIQPGSCDYRAKQPYPNSMGGFTFAFWRGDSEIIPAVMLQVPGEHNVLNALAALCIADDMGLSVRDAAHAIEKFQGTKRRFEVRGESNGVTVIDDYAHHPTEIRSTLAAARTRFSGRRIWAVWQPHTYSRTRTFFRDFISSFDDADCVLVTEIYAAREPIPADQFSSRQLAEALSGRAQSHSNLYHAPSLPEARDILVDNLLPGDVVLVLSAGDADQISEQLMEALQEAESSAVGKRSIESDT